MQLSANNSGPTSHTLSPMPEQASPERMRDIILQSLDDDKAEDILAIDLTGKSALADTMIIASGRSQRHVAAIADHIVRALKEAGLGNIKVEGLPNADWVLLDGGDVIAHVFRPEVRSFYSLERIWAPGANGAPQSAHRQAD